MGAVCSSPASDPHPELMGRLDGLEKAIHALAAPKTALVVPTQVPVEPLPVAPPSPSSTVKRSLVSTASTAIASSLDSSADATITGDGLPELRDALVKLGDAVHVVIDRASVARDEAVATAAAQAKLHTDLLASSAAEADRNAIASAAGMARLSAALDAERATAAAKDFATQADIARLQQELVAVRTVSVEVEAAAAAEIRQLHVVIDEAKRVAEQHATCAAESDALRDELQASRMEADAALLALKEEVARVTVEAELEKARAAERATGESAAAVEAALVAQGQVHAAALMEAQVGSGVLMATKVLYVVTSKQYIV